MSILIYVESRDGRFKKASFELVSYGKMLADTLGSGLVVMAAGDASDEELNSLGKYGASRVIAFGGNQAFDEAAQANAIAALANEINAAVVVLPHSISGKAIAPRLSVKLKASLATNVQGAPVDTSPFTVTKKGFSGKVLMQVELKSEKKILTLSPNSFSVTESPAQVTIEKRQMPEPAIQVLSTDRQTGKILLTEADVVVSGGRGMRSPDNWGPLEELAAILGAATACSRPVSDEGWRPHGEHVGQTGKVIAPNLYFALGISGAIQHIAGVSSSKVIVAVNKDPEAPVFAAADYGIVGDLQEVLPAMVEAFRQFKSH